MQTKIQLTPEGFKKLELEYKELIEIKKPKAIDNLQKARPMGDLSENSAYTSSREELALVEGKVREIEQILKLAEIVKNDPGNSTVTLGSKITVEANGKQDEFQIVGEFEADPMNKKLSSTSPLGSGFLGKKINEQVEIQIPAGKIIYTIKNIS